MLSVRWLREINSTGFAGPQPSGPFVGPASSVAKMQTVPAAPEGVEPVATDDEPIEEELLIEEISIDGMCGVY